MEETASVEREDAFLRSPKRVPVRRRGASRFAWNSSRIRLLVALAMVAGLGAIAAAVWQVRTYLLHNPRFVLVSPRQVQITGSRVVRSADVARIFGDDFGRSIFRIPLDRRQASLARIPWVRVARVMRIWPNQLRVAITERTPIAFARDGNLVRLVDADGVLLALPGAAAQRYSFPVINGLSSGEPASTRAASMRMYRQFVHALDADGGHASATLSEVDLSDPQDIHAIFSGAARNPMVHFGDADFLARYQVYRAHLTEWLKEYPALNSVDVRYGNQVVLDVGAAPTQTNPNGLAGGDRAAVSPSALAGASGKNAQAHHAKPQPKHAVPTRGKHSRHHRYGHAEHYAGHPTAVGV